MNVWWKIFKSLKTPLILLLDEEYEPVTVEEAESFCPKDFVYKPEVQDCDDAAWQTKANASIADKNGLGFVVGWVTWGKAFHCWNCFVTPEGSVIQLEPQTKKTVGSGYISLLVLI
jgi:hypothetical protein